MSHLLLSQGKFVFAIFDCDHEFLASDDAIIAREMTRVNACALTKNMADTRVNSLQALVDVIWRLMASYGVLCAYQKHGGHSRQFAYVCQKFVTENS